MAKVLEIQLQHQSFHQAQQRAAAARTARAGHPEAGERRRVGRAPGAKWCAALSKGFPEEVAFERDLNSTEM